MSCGFLLVRYKNTTLSLSFLRLQLLLSSVSNTILVKDDYKQNSFLSIVFEKACVSI